MDANIGFVPRAEGRKRLGIKSRTTLIARETDALIPPPVPGPNGRPAYIASELDAVAEARAAGATDAQVRELVTTLVARRPRIEDVLAALGGSDAI